MPLLLALIALVGVLAAGALEVGARRQSLRAPEGAANRVPDVYDLAYLADGLVPVHPSLAAAVDVLADRGGAAPLDRFAERLRHTSAMAERRG